MAEAQQGQESDIYRLVRMILERNFDPCIVFSFSKLECEELSRQMQGLDLSDEDEKKLIGEIFAGAVDCLSEDDRRLPQIQEVLPMLLRGVGVHHAGLLPIVKEVIEVLFQEGLLKVGGSGGGRGRPGGRQPRGSAHDFLVDD